jgi:hypothetical protein
MSFLAAAAEERKKLKIFSRRRRERRRLTPLVVIDFFRPYWSKMLSNTVFNKEKEINFDENYYYNTFSL